MRFVDEGVTIAVVANSSDIDAAEISEQIARIVLVDWREPEPPQRARLAPRDRKAFGRIWRDTVTGSLWMLNDKRDHFAAATFGDLKLDLVAVSEDRLVAAGSQVPFAMQLEDGRLVVHHDDGSTTPLAPVPFPPRNPVDASLVAGAYENSALGATIELAAAPHGQVRLVQENPIISLPPFMPLGPDTLICDRGAQIDLRRNEAGAITGISMSANRAWGIEFERRPRAD